MAETYSLSMAMAVRRELRAADPARLAELATYYQQRQGPGLGLLKEEYEHRGLPFPKLLTADVATQSK